MVHLCPPTGVHGSSAAKHVQQNIGPNRLRQGCVGAQKLGRVPVGRRVATSNMPSMVLAYPARLNSASKTSSSEPGCFACGRDDPSPSGAADDCP
jgi:hypothetical protein